MAVSLICFLLSVVTPAYGITTRVDTGDDATRLEQPVNLVPGYDALKEKLVTNAESNLEEGPKDWNAFHAPRMQPAQFLIVSSPKEKKIVFTKLDNFQTTTGRTFSLIDKGLSNPKGIAFDHNEGYLYVADSGAKSIFRYTILVDMSGNDPKLTTTKVRSTVVEGHDVEWIAIDGAGNLFYTCPKTNNINKVRASVMHSIVKGEIQASSLQIVSEKTLLAGLRADQQKNATPDPRNPQNLPVDQPPHLPHILLIYESKLNPHVAAPASILVENGDLYWANMKNGHMAGTVVQGMVHPGHAPQAPNKSQNYSLPFPATPLTLVDNGAYGIGKTKNIMFFTHNGTTPGTGLVSGFFLHNPSITLDFVTSIAAPRGLVFDGDQTMYVADPQLDSVWSFPAGRMLAHAPLTKTVSMKDAFSLVIMSSTDKAYTRNEVLKDDPEDTWDQSNPESDRPNSLLAVEESVAAPGREKVMGRDRFLARSTQNDDSSFLQLTHTDVMRAPRLEN